MLWIHGNAVATLGQITAIGGIGYLVDYVIGKV